MKAVDPAGFERELREAIEGEVRFDAASRAMYATDASVYQIVPTGVVLPRSERDVLETLRICRAHGVSITARGGGTSQGGQAVGAGMQLDFSKHMRHVLELDVEAQTVVVEPGIVLAELNAHLAPHGLELPLDLSTANRATIGGMISNNSSGTRSIVYGSTIDYVEELTVLLADGSVVTLGSVDVAEFMAKGTQDDLEGRCYEMTQRLGARLESEIVKRYPRIRRRVGGYNLDRFVPSREAFNLSHLIVGSEGTLALVLSAKLRLTLVPEARVLAVAQFSTLRGALEVTPRILTHNPSAVELLDRNLLDMTKGHAEFDRLRDFIIGDPGAVLIVEFMGEAAEELPSRIDALEQELRAEAADVEIYRAIDGPAQDRIWSLRRAGLGLTMSARGDRKSVSFVEDTAVAPESLAEYVDRFQSILNEHDTRAFFYAHASVGLLHIRPVIDMKTDMGREAFERIAEQISDLVLEFGGALSAEHGDGMVRSPFQRKMFGPVLYDAFCEIKRTFDAAGVLNPGKIVEAGPIGANLRYTAAYETRDVETVFDFSDFGGISRAAEQCAGVGACRKSLAGTMCPSYMATREEGDSTRGRANALRLAISGQLGDGGLADPSLHPILDLCLECKACKTECPTGVDMARLKAEYLHHHRRRFGSSVRSRILASVSQTARWGSRLAPVSNWVSQNSVTRLVADYAFAIDRRRTAPAFERNTFAAQWAAHAPKPGETSVAIFADTFTNFYEPEQGMAAVRFAERLGYAVTVPPRVCCGRPLISKGFLSQARQQAVSVSAQLLPLAEHGVPIVFCEPGCYSAVRDDHPSLVRGADRKRAETVAESCVTFEEWADDALESTGGDVEFRPGPSTVVLHGHCHQKALTGMEPAIQLLSRLPARNLVNLDSGCCGMAGSFGYEREHYATSRAVGERRLFPAVRALGDDSIVVAPGFSCRHQIQHFTGVEAVSPIRLLEERLRPKA